MPTSIRIIVHTFYKFYKIYVPELIATIVISEIILVGRKQIKEWESFVLIKKYLLYFAKQF